MSMIWHNGQFKEDSPVFSARDRIRLGEGVFDTMLVVDGALQNAAAHLERILHDAGIVGIEEKAVGYDKTELEHIAGYLISQNGFTQGRYALNTLITGGPGERGLKSHENPEPQIVMRAARAPEDFPPIHAIIVQNVRRNEGSPLSQIKSCNYGDNILALREAANKGANEAIMLNNAGRVTCAASSNIIMAKGEKLYTPPLDDGVMAGITRGKLIAKGTLTEQSLYPDDVKTADALFLVNSIRGIMPVISLNGEDLPQKPIDVILKGLP